MTDAPFVSYAQNGEDVVLHRAFAEISSGRYIDVGANDPTVDSISRAFYDAGWRGITVEPVPEFAERHRAERPGDLVIEAAVTSVSGQTARLLDVPGTGLSTLDERFGKQHQQAGYPVREIEIKTRRLDDILIDAGWQDEDIHFLSVDVEGSEGAVLDSLDLQRWRPWVILAEATRPQSTEPTFQSWEPTLTSASYRFVLFDGLSRFYIAQEHWDRLHHALSVPANALDDFVRVGHLNRNRRLAELEQNAEKLQADLAKERAESQAMRKNHQQVLTDLGEAEAARTAAAEHLERVSAEAAVREDLALRSAVEWRSRAMGAWADAAGSGSSVDADELDFLRRQTHHLTLEVTAMQNTLSWRITRPIRFARTLGKRLGR